MMAVRVGSNTTSCLLRSRFGRLCIDAIIVFKKFKGGLLLFLAGWIPLRQFPPIFTYRRLSQHLAAAFSSSIITTLYADAAVIADHLPHRHRSASPKNDDAPRNSSRIFHSIGIPRCNYQRRCFIWVLCSNPMPYSKHC